MKKCIFCGRLGFGQNSTKIVCLFQPEFNLAGAKKKSFKKYQFFGAKLPLGWATKNE